MKPAGEAKPDLIRGLGVMDAALLTVGSVLGTGIFLTTSDIARVLPHAGLIVFVWVLGGIFTIAGALTYAELGAMFPRSGGQYQFLKEAYGQFWGFLFGWSAFWIIMTGGIAALAVGFGQYLGAFLPYFSTNHAIVSITGAGWTWSLNGAQVGGALAIAFLTLINYIGVKEGAGVQNVVTAVKIGSIVLLALLGLFGPSPQHPQLMQSLPTGNLLSAIGVALIAVLWSYDGWYGATNVGGEMRKPERDLPIGLIAGTGVVVLLYVLMNLFYVHALPVEGMGKLDRIGEAAATVMFGQGAGRLVTAAVLISSFGCISATILYAARIYFPMAEDGVFFSSLAKIHPRFRTPSTSILAQGVWAIILTFSGTYQQLYTFVTFVVILFHAATGYSIFVLRRTRPDAIRPYRTWGYPVIPLVFIASSVWLVINTVLETPRESLIGAFIVALGIPAYLFWSRKKRAIVK